MKVKRPVRRVPFVPVASFGDIAFLLIIFFMVASVFMREANIKITPAASADIDKVETQPISVVVDESGVIWVQGEQCQRDALEPAIAFLLKDKSSKKAFLKIDHKRKQRDFGPVLMAMGKAGAEIVLVGEKKGK